MTLIELKIIAIRPFLDIPSPLQNPRFVDHPKIVGWLCAIRGPLIRRGRRSWETVPFVPRWKNRDRGHDYVSGIKVMPLEEGSTTALLLCITLPFPSFNCKPRLRFSTRRFLVDEKKEEEVFDIRCTRLADRYAKRQFLSAVKHSTTFVSGCYALESGSAWSERSTGRGTRMERMRSLEGAFRGTRCRRIVPTPTVAFVLLRRRNSPRLASLQMSSSKAFSSVLGKLS